MNGYTHAGIAYNHIKTKYGQEALQMRTNLHNVLLY